MFSSITGQQFLLCSAALIVLYYTIIGLSFRKRMNQILPHKGVPRPSVMPNVFDKVELMGRPVTSLSPVPAMILEEEEDPDTIERIEDKDTILGKEAEKVVEEIQETIHHIASNPPNPEEVYTKINAIVRNYQVFQNTEYFEPINRFIAQAVSRDCHLDWTEPELLALWN